MCPSLTRASRLDCLDSSAVPKLGGNVLLEPAAAMFLMLILVMVVNFPGKKTFLRIELYRKAKFPGNSLFLSVTFLRATMS